jgi:methionyl-tRNA formyltransferase
MANQKSSMEAPRIAFFGTPELAVYVLEELEQAGITPALVVTPPDKPVGRKLKLTPPPVKVWAEERDIAVLQTDSLKEQGDVPELANSEWDVFIVAAYNIILPKWVLELPKHGVLNVHPSLLPKMRGPSPIRSAILTDAQDAVGTSVMLLDEEIDHGPVVAQAKVELPVWPERGRVLDELLFREGGRLLAEVIPLWLKGDITPEDQDHKQATYSTKFVKADGEIQLDGDARENYRKFCAFDGWPRTYFFDANGKRVVITEASLDGDTFVIERVIPEGKQEMDYTSYTGV